MGTKSVRNLLGGAALASAITGLAGGAQAQQSVALPQIDVVSSRLTTGIAGTSTTVITAADIARSPSATLADILGQEPGIQVRNLFGSVNAGSTVVDMRGFGATATSNTLVLVNGRRLNDVDLAGVDFSTIPRESIERIEITRGNSGAVLYGDGAVGGVINIVTKNGVATKPSVHIDGTVGSYRYNEGNIAANTSSGPWSASFFGNAINSDGYRVNNDTRQRSGVSELRYTGDTGSAYLNLSADSQYLGLPGGRTVTLTSSQLATDPRGAATPFDYGKKQGLNATAGITRTSANGTELILDGGVRQKKQQSAFFNPFGDSALDTTLTTYSLTPRINSAHNLFGLQGRLIAGLDYYYSNYGSDRSQDVGDPPVHVYDLKQRTAAIYFQDTVGVLASTDVAFGARLQNNWTTARDRFDINAPGGGPFAAPQGVPLDKTENQYAAHVGVDHRINEIFAVFGRAARSFRLANVDERVGQGPFGVPTTFDLRTQTSHDFEAGVRVKWRDFTLQSSAYLMDLTDEIFFSPATFTNTNLDPTRRTGVENLATYQLTSNVRLKGGVSYTHAVFREGVFAGNDVPLVARWTGMTGVSWDILDRRLGFDAVARFVGQSRMDNDSFNVQPQIPAHAVVDVKLGGKIDRVNWSIAVQNLFNQSYYEYAVASAFTLGTFNAYPLPGRTVMAKLGVTFD